MKNTRATILGWILIPLLLAMTATYFQTAALLRSSLAISIDEQLGQEANELSLLAQRAIDPVSGEPYTSAQQVLELFIRRNVPDQNELIFVVVNGTVTERSSGEQLGRLDRDQAFVGEVSKLIDPELGDYVFQNQSVRYIAVPVNGIEDKGHMVAAIFVEEKLAPVVATLYQLAALMVLSFALAGSAGWFIAGRILRPIRKLGEFTRSTADGTGVDRLKGFNENSEIGGIAKDFNSMLDRTASAFESQRRFVDDAGHELKTPLTIVRGHLDLIKAAPNEATVSLGIIEDEVVRMTRIVKDLQMLTKSTEPGFVQKAEIEPSELIDEVFVKTSSLANRKWAVEATDLGVRQLDRQRMVQALIQLVDNAIKHTEDGDSIVIGSRIIDQRVELYVGDSGPGIPEEARSRVMERFVRGGWTAQDTEGSGLGLAIVDAIAKGHQGEVFIQASSLGGAEVGIRLSAEDISPIDRVL